MYSPESMLSHSLSLDELNTTRSSSKVVLHWQIALHWLYKKKCASKHKIPGSRKLARSIEPFGEVLMALLELAMQVHSHGSEISHLYPTAGIWFQYAAIELYPICFNAPSKYCVSQNVKEIVEDLKKNANPFNKDDYPHLFLLIEASLGAVERNISEHFTKKYWRGLRNVEPNSGHSCGLIYSLSKWASAVKDSTQVINFGRQDDATFKRLASLRTSPHPVVADLPK